MDRFPGKIWVVSHKPVAVAAGLGHMGIHRNVIHPRFGNFIVLGTVLIDAEATAYGQPIAYNPCLECKLCVAACPVGAISPDGDFNFSNCLTAQLPGVHERLLRLGGEGGRQQGRPRLPQEGERPGDGVDVAVASPSGRTTRRRTACAVCPAGEDVIGPFLTDKATFLKDTVRPLTEKEETVYVIAGSDAEEYAPRRFPKKKIKRVGSGIRAPSIDGFLFGLKLTFQPGKAAGLNAVYHFTFTGKEAKEATVTIRDGTLQVQDGHQGEADLRVTADSETWLGFLAKERSLLWALLRRRIRIKGSPKLLVAFGKCFPS